MKEDKARYSKTVRSNDYEECFNIREIDNGYIVSYSKYKIKDGYECIEEREYYSETNPVEEKTEEDKVADLISALDKLDISPKGITGQYKK